MGKSMSQWPKGKSIDVSLLTCVAKSMCEIYCEGGSDNLYQNGCFHLLNIDSQETNERDKGYSRLLRL